MLVSPFRRAGSSLPRQLAHAAKSRACDIPLGIPFEATGVAWRDGHHTSYRRISCKQGVSLMFNKIVIGVAAVGLTLAAAALQPASANYAPCVENPAGPGCPGALTPIKPSVKPVPRHAMHAHAYRAPRSATKG